MNAKALFFERYDGFDEYPTHVLDGLTDEQLRCAPHQALNPILWILWHITRCEDMGVSGLLANRKQVLDDGPWPSRLGVEDRRVGTGMTKLEVTDLSARLDLQGLLAYRAAVVDRTVEVVNALPLAELAQPLQADNLERVLDTGGAGGMSAPLMVEAYLGRTKGWLLGHLALTHNYYHIGQAFSIRAMTGAPDPW